ncbi:MAG: cold shock domain-containing protein [Planctomycetes bacterium]|nr:cold shock domain-containing protein [Planctomycetota bacterium]
MSDTIELNNIEGNVKWFDPRKGYGFIVGPQGQDIFVHFSVIDQAEGFKTLRDGEAVTYSASKGQKGWSATAVKSTRVPTPAKTAQAT